MHVHKKTGEILPSVFSHALTVGCSIQRDSIATHNELVKFVTDFLSSDSKRIWKGVLTTECSRLRDLTIDNTQNRSICVYDTAERSNPAHGEFSKTQHIEEADHAELRHQLFTAFGDGKPISPNNYRDSAVWEDLPNQLK